MVREQTEEPDPFSKPPLQRRGLWMEASALPIRVVAPGPEEAARLVAALGDFPARIDGENGFHEVQIVLDRDTSELLVKLFRAISRWVADGDTASCEVYFGDRSYTLLAADGKPSDPTQFLLERTIQLQTALDTRVVIEQAKGALAERFGLPIDEAFELLRRSARSSGKKIHGLAGAIVSSPATPTELERTLDRR